MNFDIYMVGVGGQGILTIAEMIAKTAIRKDMGVSFYPTKGMAQRGGFVKAQLRICDGALPGPDISERAADVGVSMEVSETLKAIRFVKPGGTMVIYDYEWQPTDVMLRRAAYPALRDVVAQCLEAGLRVVTLKRGPAGMADNIAALGALAKFSPLRDIMSEGDIKQSVFDRFPKAVQRNEEAFEYAACAEVAEG